MKQKITKVIILFLILTFLSVSTYAVPNFNITNSYIQQLDEDSYRLRVFVDWDNINYFNPNFGFNFASTFHSFGVSLLGTSQYNATINSMDGLYPINTPGNWHAGHFGGEIIPLNHGLGFGYDFDMASPPAGPITLGYSAGFIGGPFNQFDPVTGEFLGYDYETASFSGSFTVGETPEAVPEPATILLFGLGLAGFGALKKSKSN